MLTLIQFHFRRILRTPVFFVTFCALVLSILGMQVILWKASFRFIHYMAKFDIFAYVEVIILALLFTMAVYILRGKSTLESVALYSNATTHVAKILGLFCVSLLFLLVPVGYVVVGALREHTGILFTLTALCYASIRWLMAIVTAISMAALCVHLIQSSYVYILALPVTILFTFLNQYFLQIFTKDFDRLDQLSAFFSVQKPFVHAPNLDYTGPRLDQFLLWKVLIIFLGFLLVVSLIGLLYTKKKSVVIVVFLSLIVLESLVIYRWFGLYPTMYAAGNKMYVDNEHSSAQVLSYGGEISLGETTSVKCTVVFRPTKEQVTFRLDQSFVLDRVVLNGVEVFYERMGDFFTVSVGEVGKEMVLTLEYEGRVYYMSRIHCIDIFTTRWASALPPRFAFLPLMDGDMTKKQFDLSVLSHNTVVSNLQVEGGEKNQYHLTGESISVALFSGYFVEERSNGHTIIRMKYNGLTDYEAIYERGFQHGVYNGLTNEREEGEDFPCSKIFMMQVDYETYGYPLRMDEYLLIDYGGFYGSSLWRR